MANFKSKLGDFLRGEKTASGVLTLIIVLLVLVCNVLLYIIGSYFGLYLYYPSHDDLEISGATDEYFEDAINSGKRVSIIFCQVKDDVENSTTGSYVLNTAEQFKERYPDFIDIEFINITVKRKYKDGSTFGDYVDVDKYVTENEQGIKTPILKTSVIFECEDNFKVLSDYSTDGYASFFTLDSSNQAVAYNGEEMIASMVKWVLTDEHKTAYFTMYHGETYDIGFANMLTAAGYKVAFINLHTVRSVPDDAGLVIISNPKQDFRRGAAGTDIIAELDVLERYVNGGGSVYVSIDPFSKPLTLLEEFLKGYGIEVSSTGTESGVQHNIVRDPQSSNSSDYLSILADLAKDSDEAIDVAETVEAFGNGTVFLRSCAALELSGNAKALLYASSTAQTYAGAERTDSDGGYCLAAVSTYESEDGKVGHVFAVPSIYLTSTDALVSGGYSNRSFIYAVMENHFGAPEMPHGCKTVYYDSEVLNDLSMGTARIYTVIIMLIPVALAVTGAVIVIRRKNR